MPSLLKSPTASAKGAAVASKRRCGAKVPSPSPSKTDTSLDDVLTTATSGKPSPIEIGDRQVAVKIRQSLQRERAPLLEGADGELARRAEGAVAIVQQHADDIFADVRDHDVQRSVAVEIGQRGLGRSGPVGENNVALPATYWVVYWSRLVKSRGKSGRAPPRRQRAGIRPVLS